MDNRLEELLAEWTRTLLGNLEDPMTRENVNLLRDEQKPLVDEFLRSRTLPDPLSTEFIQAVQDVLSGLVKVVVKTPDLQKALLSGGSPCTLQEMNKRFENYLRELAKGKDLAKVRIVVE
jgi:hypothetical protein